MTLGILREFKDAEQAVSVSKTSYHGQPRILAHSSLSPPLATRPPTTSNPSHVRVKTSLGEAVNAPRLDRLEVDKRRGTGEDRRDRARHGVSKVAVVVR